MAQFAKPAARDMFSDATNSVEMTERYDAFRATLSKSLSKPIAPIDSPRAELAKNLADERDFIGKSIDPRIVDSVRNALAGTDLGKDISTTSPLSTGLVAYDLAAPALMLTPRPTPLRNRISRTKGQGLGHQYKRILGFSGTQTGGAAGGLINPGINESTTNVFGPGSQALARGPKIAYAADEQYRPYVEASLSDETTWAAQFAGESFQDIRATSSESLLWASMLSEEALLLGGRGTKTGYVGAIPAPVISSVAARAAGANEVGNTANIATVYFYATSVGVWGESLPSTVVSSTALAAATGQVLVVNLTDAAGALGYRVYAGTTTGPTNAHPAAVSNGANSFASLPGDSVPGGAVVVQFTGAGTGGVPSTGANPPAANTTAQVNNYDGILTVLSDPAQTGYFHRLNNTFGTADGANVGNTFGNAFASLYDSVKADPDEILASGADRKQISDLLKTQTTSNYMITVDNANQVHNAQVGSLVTGIQNPVTGKMVNITLEPWLPQGNLPIISWTLPIPNSNVGECWQVRAPQDLSLYQWPINEFRYTASTYWFSTLIPYAAMYSGMIASVYQA